MDRKLPLQNQLLTTEELVKLTGLTRRFWEVRRLSGDTPPFIQISARAVRYRWEDVETWLNKRTRRSTSDQGEKNEA